jgi:hypothetical protein
MALSNAVEGATHTAQQITWVDGDGDPLNLTGATITARIKDLDTGEARAATGTMEVDAEAGLFSWVYSTADVATAGAFNVQFVATFGAANDKTLAELWEVEAAIVGHTMTSATALQWGLLLGYLALSIVALVSLRRVESRPMAAAVLFLAAPHIVYYGLFLIWPDVLDSAQTMQFSIALRYQMMFITAAALGMKITGRSWRL